MNLSPDFFALVVVAVVYMLDRLGMLDRFKRRSAADAAGELAIAEHTIARLRTERNEALQNAQQLQQTRSLEPILAALHANTELQAQVLDRLSHHNGSFKEMHEGMEEIRTSLHLVTEGLRVVTGFIAAELGEGRTG